MAEVIFPNIDETGAFLSPDVNARLAEAFESKKPSGEITGVSLALEDTGQSLFVDSIGIDGLAYGHTATRRYPVRSADSFAAAPEQGPDFVAIAGSGRGIQHVTRTSTGYVVIFEYSDFTNSIWHAPKFNGPYARVLNIGPWSVTSWAKPRIIAGQTWMLLGEYTNSVIPSVSAHRWLSTDGGMTWDLIHSTLLTSDQVNSHNHTALIRGDGRLYVSEGDGPNNWFGYSDDRGTSWIDVPTDPDVQQDIYPYSQPTLLVDMGDKIAMSPDRGPYQPGVWLMDPNTHKQEIAREIVEGGPYNDASKQYGRSIYAQPGPDSGIFYAMFADGGSGNYTTYILATPNSGRQWAMVAAIDTTGGTLRDGIVGPDRNGNLFMRGIAVPTYGSNVIRAKQIDW